MSTESPAAPAPVNAPAPAAAAPAAAPQASPRLPIAPAAGSQAAHMENAKKIFASDPSKTAAKPSETPAKPAAVSADDAPPPAPSIIKKADAAKPAEVAPAAVVHPEDSLAEPTTDAAKAGWKELKAITKTERSRAAALEQQISDLKKAAPVATSGAETPELTALRADLKAAQDRLLTLDVQSHPDFTRQFVEPKKKALATASEVLDYNGKEGVDVAAVLAKPLKDFNATISEFTKDMNPADAGMVMQSLRQARELHSAEQLAIANAGQLHKSLQEKAASQQKQAFESVVGEALPNFGKFEITETMSAEDKTAAMSYNQSVDGLRAAAEGLAFGKVSEKGVAEMALKSVALEHMVRHALPRMEREIQSRNDIISQLTTELKSLRGGKAPVVSGGDPVDAPAARGSGSNPKAEIENMAKALWRK